MTYTLTHLQSHTPIHISTYKSTHTHTHTLTHTYQHTHVCLHITHTNARTETRTHLHTHIRIHTHAHTQTYTYTCTHTNVHNMTAMRDYTAIRAPSWSRAKVVCIRHAATCYLASLMFAALTHQPSLPRCGSEITSKNLRVQANKCVYSYVPMVLTSRCPETMHANNVHNVNNIYTAIHTLDYILVIIIETKTKN